MNTVKGRLLRFIKEINVTVAEFEREIGVSGGYVSNISKSIQPDKLEKISNLYPVLNLEWLLVGKGPMLKTAPSATLQQSGRSANYQGTFTEPINTIMGSGNSIGGTARERIAQKKAEKGIGTHPEAMQLKHENQLLNVEIEKLRVEIEHLKSTIEFQQTFIEEKERMIKILLEKK